MSQTIPLLAFVLCFVSLAAAEYCGYYDGYRWYCDDPNTYCCGFRDGTALCCQYDPFYTWWYFWLGIAGFVFLVSMIAALCRRRRLQSAQAARNRAHLQTAVIQTQTNVPAGYANPNFGTNPNVAAPPPPYPVVANDQKEFAEPPPYNPQDYIPNYPPPPATESTVPYPQTTAGNSNIE